MKYLFKDLDKFLAGLRNKSLFLFLDYDGTLAPIAEAPGRAVMPAGIKNALNKLADGKRCKVAVISGRSLADVKRIVGVRGLVYAGNHGLEIQGPRLKYGASMLYKYRRTLKRIRQSLASVFKDIKGVLTEDKGLTLSVHYRKVKASRVSRAQALFREVTNYDTARGNIKVKAGKKVLEIRPPVQWNKGSAVLWLIKRWKFFTDKKSVLPVYIGDDLTDEDAFGALNGRESFTIMVGKPRSSLAKYYLRNTSEVEKLLNLIVSLTKGVKSHGKSKNG